MTAIAQASSELLRDWREMLEPRSMAANGAAGLTVAMVAIPLNLALAVACGLPPAAGLISGAVGGAIAALLGGARITVTGPEVALAPMTALIVAAHGIEGLALATALAGIVQIALGALGAGRLVHLLPRPVVVGFLAAIAVVVFDTQLPHVVGIHDGARLSAMRALPDASVLSLPTLAIAAAVVATMVILPRVAPRAPAPLVALAAAVGATALLDLDVERLQAIATGGLSARLPPLGTEAVLAVLPSAIGLALLASVDSLLCAVSVDARVPGRRHRSDQELMAQGLANIACSLVGGMPVAAAVVRSVAAIEARATTRLAALVQSGVLLAVALVLGPHLDAVPFAALAGVLLVVGAKLVDLREVLALVLARRAEAVILGATTVAILAIGFVEGLAVGVVLAMIALARDAGGALVLHAEDEAGATRVRFLGPLVFAAQERIGRGIERVAGRARTLDLDLRGITAWDASGLGALRAALVRARVAEVTVRAPSAIPAELLARELASLARIERAPEEPRASLPPPELERAVRPRPVAERWAIESAE